MTIHEVTHNAAKQRIVTHPSRIVGDVTNCRIERTNRGIHHTWQVAGVGFFEQFAYRYRCDRVRRRLHD